ncbi:MAG: hypothetical protein ACSHYB_01670 [Roseibacillus sp.]
MKSPIVSFFSLGFLLASCSQHQRISAEQEIATPVPSPKMAKVSGKSYVELKQGYQIYRQHCAQCHEHQLPSTTTLPEYHAKIASMAHLADLSAKEENSLQTYLDVFTDR